MKKLLLILAISALISNYALADASTYLNFTAVNGPATVALDSVGTPNEINLLYSTDNCSTWNTYTIGNTISLASGAKVYFKALNTNSTFSRSSAGFYRFEFSSAVAADGNIMSLLDATMTSDYVPYYAFVFLFEACTSLTSAPALPATTLAPYCYSSMFDGCTSLTSAPVLPATTLAIYCYSNMFSDCSSLTSAPALPATTLAPYCCYYMFSGCSSLTSAPILPATQLQNYCYCGMFSGCTSLTTAPVLPATTLYEGCYKSMFQGCTSLTTAPILPATQMQQQCYECMFCDCTSFTTAPALPATQLAHACYNAIFGNCTSLTSPPALPATILVRYCYVNMFTGCTSLTQLPELPADSLPECCYLRMFYDCSSLILNAEGAGKEWSIQASYVGSSSYFDMFTGTAGTMSGTPSANTTYYLPAYVEDVDTSSADAYFYCNTTFDYVPVARFHFTMYRTGGSDTVDIYFANDTSFVINRLPRTVQIIDSVTGNTTTVTITINQAASSPDCNEINVHLENLAPSSTYYLTLTPLDASDNVLDSYSSGFVTPEADSPTPTALEDCHADHRDLFFPSDNTDVYTIDGRYLGKYHDSLPPAIYIMWENGKAHKFAKIR